MPMCGANVIYGKKLNNLVNNNGGSSMELTAITDNRPDWNKVKDVLLGVRPISDLGCN